jgi:prepilin-type N-terminal cleavage/methylation domain-containing protein
MVHDPIAVRTLAASQRSGFGLIELMVSISVIVVVTSVILAKHSSYNGASLLRSQAYELALTIRELQLFAVSSTRDTTGFYNVYGLVLSTTTPNRFVIFRDSDGDYYYDASTEEFGPQGVIDSRYEISRIEYIGTGTDAGGVNSTAVVFERPNFDALLYKSAGTEVDPGVQGVEIDIRLKGTTGTGPNEVRTIEITRAGQIAVKNL